MQNKLNEQLIADYYLQHRGELLSFVAKSVACSHVAEDIVQDVFMRLLQTDKMITEVTLPALVYTISRHLIYDYHRRRAHIVKYESVLLNSSTNDDVMTVYSSSDMTEILERGMVKLLSGSQRQVFSMNVFDGMKVGTIAETLGENYKTVEGRLGIARKKIRKYMQYMMA